MAEAKNRLCSKKHKSKGHTANVKAERRSSKGKAQQTKIGTHESNTNNARNKHTKAAEGDSIGDPDDTRKRQRQRMTEETMRKAQAQIGAHAAEVVACDPDRSRTVQLNSLLTSPVGGGGVSAGIFGSTSRLMRNKSAPC